MSQQQQQQSPVALSDFLARQSFLKDVTPGQAFLYGAATAVGAFAAAELLREGNLVDRTKKSVFYYARRYILEGYIRGRVSKEVSKLTFRTSKDHPVHNALPANGLSFEEVMAQARQLRTTLDEKWDDGHLSGTVYHGGKDLTSLINDTLVLYQWTNPLHMDTFGSVRQMEAEIVQMCVDLFHGTAPHREDACGAVTSGGTDSICMAIKSHREWGRDKRGITRPNIVCPITVHPAFDKACHYYDIEKKTVPVNPATGVVDPEELERYVTEDTVCIVASAVNYPYGTVDDVAKIAEIARRHGTNVHVDCCLGGFVLQFLEDAGIPNVPVVDFRIPGVSTISVDTHKFGFAPKGSSVVLFDNKELRRYMYFSIATWPGGLYCSPGFNGSRPGNIIAGTWAAMMAMGKDGYVKSARDVYNTMQRLVKGIRVSKHLYVLGNPQTSVVAFASDTIDVYELKERVTKRFGWQLHTLQFPPALQFSLTWVHSQDGIIDKMVDAISTIANELGDEAAAKRAKGEKVVLSGDSATMYGTQQKIPDRSVIDTMTKAYLDKYYQTEF